MPELDRRDFLKIVGMSAGTAATAACQEPIERVIPYLNQPEEVVPGLATYYNSTCRECPAGCGIRVKTREGRPIKVDGNPDDPIGRGSLCVRGQAGLHRTYDAARFQGPLRREGEGFVPISWDEGMELLVEKLRAANGRISFLGGAETGTLDRIIDAFLSALGSPNRLRFELYAHEALRSANEMVFGTGAIPQFALDRADVVIAFGTDFLETWLNPLQNQVNFAAGRAQGRGFAAFVGPRFGLSASNLDQWLAPEPGTEVLVALALAREVAARKGTTPALRELLADFSPESVADRTGVSALQIRSLAERIAGASAPLALPPGVEIQGTNAASFAAAVQILNYVSGAVGNTVVFGPDHNVGGLARFSDLKELAGKLRGGEVSVLLVHGANPVHCAPQVGFADAMRSGGVFTVSFSSASDETTALADLVLPDHTPFESWGDSEPIRGIRRLQQPTIRPLNDTRALGDVLLDAGRALGRAGSLPGGDFRDAIRTRWGLPDFDQRLANGGRFRAAPARGVALAAGVGNLSFEPAALSGESDGLALVVYPSLHFYDGRSQRLAVLNEIPDPVTTTMWGSYAEIHEDTARELGVELGDVVEVSTEAGSIELPVYPHKAVRPGVVAISAGQGHQPVDPNAPDPDYRQSRETTGVNALEIVPGRLDPRSGGLAWLSTRASVRPTGSRALVVRAQTTFDQEGRGIAKSTTLAALARHEHPEAASEHGEAAGEHGEAEGDASEASRGPAYGDASHLETKQYDPAADAHPESPYRWGMSVDLDACTGCNACVMACGAENNGPIVGPDNARGGREMHWIRIERYVELGHDGQIDVRSVPMMCQHCGAAPCESVCPTIATYHNKDGLNVMVPNRCIGTRFCSNNCPYKARRFNYWPYDFFYRSPEELHLNPDVTVRSKGVMEKCTMCLQRINDVKDRAALENRNVRDGEMQTACQQACPSQAIHFGNLRDPESEVSKLREDPRAYRVFEHLYTRPGVSYRKALKREI